MNCPNKIGDLKACPAIVLGTDMITVYIKRLNEVIGYGTVVNWAYNSVLPPFYNNGAFNLIQFNTLLVVIDKFEGDLGTTTT